MPTETSSDAGLIIEGLASLPSKFEADLQRLLAAPDGVTEQDIRALQAQYLGKNGQASKYMKTLGRLPAGERPAVGVEANRTKAKIEELVTLHLESLGQAALAADLARSVDVTLPGFGAPLGSLHPLTLVRREVEHIFL